MRTSTSRLHDDETKQALVGKSGSLMFMSLMAKVWGTVRVLRRLQAIFEV